MYLNIIGTKWDFKFTYQLFDYICNMLSSVNYRALKLKENKNSKFIVC